MRIPNDTYIASLNELALAAKSSDDAFNTLLAELKPSINVFIKKYSRQWVIERDEVEQWAMIELWNAVRSYDSNGMPFDYWWKWVVSNHIRTKIYRIVYGKKSVFSRKAIRHDFREHTGKSEYDIGKVCSDIAAPTTESAETTFLKDHLNCLLKTKVRSEISQLTDLERSCVTLFYFQGYSYGDMQKELCLNSSKPVDNALSRVKKKIRKNQDIYLLYSELSALK